jgi:hypothetical protein
VSHRHPLELLATDRGYAVHFCSECEVVHVEVGPVTLRLRPGALDTLASVLARASARLHHAEPETETVRIELDLALQN